MSWKLGCVFVVVVAFAVVPAHGQCSDGPPSVDTQFDCCTGPNCGAGVPEYECYSVSTANVQCWGRPIDLTLPERQTITVNACEQLPDFQLIVQIGTVVLDREPPTAMACGAVIADGSVNNQLLRGLGGYSLFESQILKRAEPRIVREAAVAAAGGPAGDEPEDVEIAAEEGAEEADEEDQGVAVLSEITTSIEVGDWEFRSVEGDSSGVRLFWRREGETGRLYGLSASYQEADPDLGNSTRLLNGNFSIGHTMGDSGSWGLNATVSEFSGLHDDTLLGGSGYLAFSRYSDKGSVFSGGVLFQYLSSDQATDDVQTVGYGVGLGFPIGRRLALDLEAYGVSILETYRVSLPALETDGIVLAESELRADDSFYTAGAQLSLYLTSRFALMLGYRLLEGIDDLDSQTYTFGGSTRWQ